ncbi:SAP domain protein [Cryptosporidium felis]|nr:SAP domain protein [Cryptosporidium felis]
MSENYHQERSRLIQQHKDEIRAIEKEIKSKKGVLKDQCKRRLEEVLKRQEGEITKFEAKYGSREGKSQRESKYEDLSGRKDDILGYKGRDEDPGKSIVYEERQWNSLSKSELETECKLRGINSKGSKEDLVTRLFIFTADQKSKLGKGGLGKEDEIKLIRSETREDSNQNLPSRGFTVLSNTNKFSPPEINYSEAGGTGKKKGRSQNKKINYRKNVHPSQNSWAAFCARNDIPRDRNYEKKNLENSSSEDYDKRNHESDFSSQDSRESSSNAHEIDGSDFSPSSQSEVDNDEEAQRKNRRRAVMVKVLEKMFSSISLKERKTGIGISEIENQLTKLNVKNFKPELLGYKSVEDWISSQSRNVLTYDKEKKLIFPPGLNISSSKSNRDDPYFIDSLSEKEEREENESEYFM